MMSCPFQLSSIEASAQLTRRECVQSMCFLENNVGEPRIAGCLRCPDRDEKGEKEDYEEAAKASSTWRFSTSLLSAVYALMLDTYPVLLCPSRMLFCLVWTMCNLNFVHLSIDATGTRNGLLHDCAKYLLVLGNCR